MKKQSYDKFNQQKEKYETRIALLEKEIRERKKKNEELEEENKGYRKTLYDAKLGKDETSKLKREKKRLEDENKALIKKSKKPLDDLKHAFNEEQIALINGITSIKLPYTDNRTSSLLTQFQKGSKELVEMAHAIKNGTITDTDYYHKYHFRDTIVAMFTPILAISMHSKSNSPNNMLKNLMTKKGRLDKQYLDLIPELKEKRILSNLNDLLGIANTSFHGTKVDQRSLVVDRESGNMVKERRFLNLDKDTQVETIFILLKSIYVYFTQKDNETYLRALTSKWFVTEM